MNNAEPDRNDKTPWGEITCRGPLWRTDALTEWDRENSPDVGGLPPLSFTLDIRSFDGELERHPIFGGYCDGRLLRVLYRFYTDATPGGRLYPADSAATLGPEDTYIAGPSQRGEYLRVEDWWEFGELRAGAFFKIQGKLWSKLTVKDLRKVIKGRIFDVAFPLAKAPPGMKFRPGEDIYIAHNHPPRSTPPLARYIRFRAGPRQ